MTFTLQARRASGVPPGQYHAEFARAEHAEQLGAAVRLVWRVLKGPYKGEEATRICGANLTPKSTLTKFVHAIVGAAIDPGAFVDLLVYVRTRGLMEIEETESGITRVASFAKI